MQDIATVTHKTIETYLASIKNGKIDAELSASSKRRVLSSIKQLHKFAKSEGYAETNPSLDVETQKLPKRLPRALTIDEMQRMIDMSEGDTPIQMRDNALLEFMYASGARVSEVSSLDIDDIDFEVKVVRLFGKGAKERILPLTDRALAAIWHYTEKFRPILVEKGRGTARLFVNTRGNPLTRQSIYFVIQHAATHAGITKKVHPHSIRHSFATHLLEGGADVRIVQELLGHSNVVTTEIYTEVSKETLKENYALYHPRM
jgi:integrase/recombinase XerD